MCGSCDQNQISSPEVEVQCCSQKRRSMERFRSTSPESSTSAFSWRKTLRSRGCILNREDRSSFTSSLPSPVVSKDRELKIPKNITPQLPQNEVIKEGMDCRRRYSIFEDLPQRIIERPRSASVQINPLQLQFIKKKLLRNSIRARPSSGRFGRIRLDSSNQFSATTCKVDDAFANIRSQLAQLSEEDMLLQERLDRLALEIASMQRCVDRKCYLPAVAPANTFIPCGQREILTSPNLSSPSASLMMLSASQSNILAIAEESWEDEEKDMVSSRKGGDGKSISNYLNLSNSAQSSCEPSLGSCESLENSEGSLSIGQPSCCNVIMIKPRNPSPDIQL